MAAAVVKTVKKAGKENAAPRSKVDRTDGIDRLDDFDDDMTESTGKPTRVQSELPRSDNSKSQGLQKKLDMVTAERDRLRSQRDAFSKQFDDLSRLRVTEAEGLFNKYKGKAAIQAKAQSDIIENLSILNEKLQGRLKDLEKALKDATALSDVPPPKADPKEVKSLKDELGKVQAASKAKDEKIASLEREYKAEQAQSQSLQALSKSTSTPAPAAVLSTDEAAQDAACLRLYEDLTELNIVSCRIKDMGKGGKEITFNCVHTSGGRSLNFKLRCFNHLEPSLAKIKGENPWVKKVAYHPEHLEKETDREFVERLGVFADEFTCARDQLGVLFDDLKVKMGGD